VKESLFAKALRGFFILLPFLIAYLMAGQLVDMLLGLTQPIVDLMPGILFESEGMQRVFAFGVLIVICILVAQIAHTALARRFGNWFEQRIMSKFPPYQVLKSLSQRLSGAEDESLQPALMTVAPDGRWQRDGVCADGPGSGAGTAPDRQREQTGAPGVLDVGRTDLADELGHGHRGPVCQEDRVSSGDGSESGSLEFPSNPRRVARIAFARLGGLA
jgi:hypothetical protein